VFASGELRREQFTPTFNTGFKFTGRGKNNCFGCKLDPPTLSVMVIKNLGEKFCKMDPKVLTDYALTSSHTSKKTIQKQKSKPGVPTEQRKKKSQETQSKTVPNGDKTKKDVKGKKK
jgi:hypothetical protein